MSDIDKMKLDRLLVLADSHADLDVAGDVSAFDGGSINGLDHLRRRQEQSRNFEKRDKCGANDVELTSSIYEGSGRMRLIVGQ